MGLKKRVSQVVIGIIDRENLSNSKLAHIMGCNRNTINNYRLMKTAPGPDFIDKLFEIFNVNPDWIYKGKGNQYKTDKNDTDPRPIKDIPAGPVDINILQPVIQAVEDHLKNLSLVLAPKKKAELIILLYEHFAAAEAEVDQETVIKYLRLAA